MKAMHPSHRQSGIALLVVLVMVLLVTLLGVAAVRTLAVQERMASNSFDRNLALQSAERVLREAEALAFAQSIATPLNTGFDIGRKADGTEDATLPEGSFSGSCSSSTERDLSPCTEGYCSQPSTGCAERWKDSNFTGWKTVTATAPASAASASTWSEATLASGTQQQYIIEFLGKNFACDPTNPDDLFNCSQYRITVRTNTNTERAVVQLQSHFLAQPK